MKGKVGGKLSACLVVHGWVWLKEDVVVNIISHTHQENDFGLTLMVINDIYYIIHTAKLLLKYLSKDQLISKCHFDVIVSTQIPTKFF